MSQLDTITVRRLGQYDYLPVFKAMQCFTEQRDSQTADELWVVEHPPVFTQGRNSKPEHLLNPGDIPVEDIDRGGQVTYHGPGQLVIYVMMDLSRAHKGVRDLVSAMENAIIKLLDEHDVKAIARADAPGVYVDQAKVAALGLRVKCGRSYHGLSLNVDMDLRPFQRINPCGYPGMQVTQLRALGIDSPFDTVSQRLTALLAKELGYNATVNESTGSIFDTTSHVIE